MHYALASLPTRGLNNQTHHDHRRGRRNCLHVSSPRHTCTLVVAVVLGCCVSTNMSLLCICTPTPAHMPGALAGSSSRGNEMKESGGPVLETRATRTHRLEKGGNGRLASSAGYGGLASSARRVGGDSPRRVTAPSTWPAARLATSAPRWVVSARLSSSAASSASSIVKRTAAAAAAAAAVRAIAAAGGRGWANDGGCTSRPGNGPPGCRASPSVGA